MPTRILGLAQQHLHHHDCKKGDRKPDRHRWMPNRIRKPVISTHGAVSQPVSACRGCQIGSSGRRTAHTWPLTQPCSNGGCQIGSRCQGPARTWRPTQLVQQVWMPNRIQGEGCISTRSQHKLGTCQRGKCETMTAVSHCCHALQWVGCTTLAATNASRTRLGPVLVAAAGVWCRQTACPV